MVFVTLTVNAVLDKLHVCRASEVSEPLEWDLLCGKTSLLLRQVMAGLLSAIQRLAPPQQVRPLSMGRHVSKCDCLLAPQGACPRPGEWL
jgi:hypothetical protein